MKRIDFVGCMKRKRRPIVLVLAALTLPVHAAVLEEITVTAQKREESLQDVSVSVSAYSTDTMRQIGLTNTNDLGLLMPNVEIVAPFGNQQAQVHLRGAGSVDFNANTQTTIGFYVDEVYLPNTFQHTVQMFDLERVEVLRGPQGTLYGRNATAGAINVITAKPQQEFGGFGRLSYGRFDEVRMEGAVTGGLTDNLSGRLSFVYQNDDGWMTGRTNLPGTVGGDDFNDTEYYAWRGQLAWMPREDVEVHFNVHGSQDNSSGFSYQNLGVLFPNFSTGCDPTVRDDCVDFFGYRDLDGFEERGDPTQGDFNLQGEAEYETVGGYVRVDWALDAFTLTSISAYEKFERFHPEDADASPATVSHNFYGHEVSGWSQEIRLTSTNEGPWDWILGFYYGQDELNADNTYNFFGTLTFQTYDQEQTSIAGYGHVGYQFNDQWRLYGGVRYTEDEIELTHSSDIFDPPPPVGFGTGLSPFARNSGSPTYDQMTWKVGVEYTPDADLLLYGHVSTGYKSGGVNVGFGDPGEFNIYDEEDLLAYEIGLKSTLLDGKARFNVSGFYYDYRDLQAFDQSVGAFGNLVTVIGNADEAVFKGLEFEVSVTPMENLDLGFNLGFLDTEFKEFVRPITGADLSGNENVLAPEWKASGIARYEWAVPMLFDGRMALSFDWNWTDEMFHTVENLNDVRAKARWLVGGRLSYLLGDKVEVAVWGRNLSNTIYRTQSFDFRSVGFITSVPNQPRTYGVEVVYNF